MDKCDQERMMDFIEKQVKRGKKNMKEPEYTELKREGEEEKLTLSLNVKAKKPSTVPVPTIKTNPDLFASKEKKEKPVKDPSTSGTKRKSALDEILEEEERKKEKKNRKDHWLCEGIIVKAVAKTLGDKYFKKKGVVESLKDKYEGMVRMLDTGDLIKFDQAHLETVIPSEGRLVKIVNGAYRGETATLKEIHEKSFCATLEIANGVLKGRLVKVQYEDFSKLHVS